MSRHVAAKPGAQGRLYSWPLIALCGVALVGFGSNFVIQPVLPLLVLDRGGDPTLAGLIIGAFSFPSVLLRPFMGRLVDETDRLVVLSVSLLVIGLSGLVYLVPNLLLIFANRVVHGAAWAGFNTAGHSTLASLAPAERRAEASGLYNLMPGIAQMLMPGIGLLLLGGLGAQGPFLACSGLALVGAAMVLAGPLRGPTNGLGEPARRVPELDESSATQDWPTGLADAAVRPGRSALARRLSSFAWGRERKGGERADLLDRGALGPMAIELLFSLPFTLFLVFPPVFATLRGIPIEALTIYYPLYGGTLVVIRAISGRFLDRVGRTTVITAGAALAVAGLALAAIAESVTLLTAGGILYAAAAAFTSPTTMALAIDRAHPRRLGAAMATYTLGFQLAIGAGATLWGVVIDLFGYPAPYLVAIAVEVALLAWLRVLASGRRWSGTER